MQGSQNRISQTTTSTPSLSNDANSLIAGTIIGAAGIAGMFAVKPSVKQFVNAATQKNLGDSKKAFKKSELDFKFSSDKQNSSNVKVVDISAIIQQTAKASNTNVGAKEANFIKPDNLEQNSGSNSKQTVTPETTIGSAPKDAIQKIAAQENNKTLTFKEMDKTQMDGMDKTATQIEGASSLFFGAPLYAALKKTSFGKYSSLALSGFKLFNKGLLMTGQIPMEKELNMNGDMGKAAGHELATFGTGVLVPLIPVVGPAIAFLDACGSTVTGISLVEETVRVVENGAEKTFEAGFNSGFNREWDATVPKVENLENYITKLEKSIQTSESGQRKDKQVKLLQKIQKYKSEVAKRKNIREFNTKMFNSEFTAFEP